MMITVGSYLFEALGLRWFRWSTTDFTIWTRDTRVPPGKKYDKMLNIQQPESESVIEEVAEDLLLPGGEVGTVGGGLEGEEDVALVVGPHLGHWHSLLVEQVPRMEEEGVELSQRGEVGAICCDVAALLRTVGKG